MEWLLWMCLDYAASREGGMTSSTNMPLVVLQIPGVRGNLGAQLLLSCSWSWTFQHKCAQSGEQRPVSMIQQITPSGIAAYGLPCT